jgi:hypothetical protein
MKIQGFRNIGMVVMMALFMSLAGQIAFAGDEKPMTPEAAAKKENFRKQHDQRITPEKRKAAVDALKAERLRLQKAKEAVEQSQPSSIDNKQQ